MALRQIPDRKAFPLPEELTPFIQRLRSDLGVDGQASPSTGTGFFPSLSRTRSPSHDRAELHGKAHVAADLDLSGHESHLRVEGAGVDGTPVFH